MGAVKISQLCTPSVYVCNYPIHYIPVGNPKHANRHLIGSMGNSMATLHSHKGRISMTIPSVYNYVHFDTIIILLCSKKKKACVSILKERANSDIA